MAFDARPGGPGERASAPPERTGGRRWCGSRWPSAQTELLRHLDLHDLAVLHDQHDRAELDLAEDVRDPRQDELLLLRQRQLGERLAGRRLRCVDHHADATRSLEGRLRDTRAVHIDLRIVFAGAIVGFTVGLTGMGGGALMTPILVLLFGITPSTAVSSDLLASLVMKPVGGGVHLRNGTVNWSLVGWLCLGSVPAAFSGVLILKALGSGARVEDDIKA